MTQVPPINAHRPRPPDWAEPTLFQARRLGAWLGDTLALERSRWALWLPVMLGVGIGAYFSLPFEPPGWTGGMLLLVALGGAWLSQGWARLAAWALLAVALGFTAAQLRTWSVATPVLQAELEPVGVEGRVVDVLPLDEGGRVILEKVVIPGVAPDATPARVRVRLRTDDALPSPGQRIRVFAVLQSPPAPAEPAAYDFRRHAYFLGIGAVGFALGRVEAKPGPPPTWGDRFTALLEQTRLGIADRVGSRLQEGEAAVATALLTGEQGAIPEADLGAMRESGLQHLLSISGLHIGLVAGLVFLSLRALLALVEPVALRHPIKKWAAVAALLAVLAYMTLVGTAVPTLRSVLMTGVMLLAVLADRNPFSMRVVALAAAAVLLFQPEAMLGPSFQMSFGAVVALIAAYEWLQPRMAAWRMEAGPVRRAMLYVVGLSLTSLVAGTATMPFALYHFQQVANYGLLANLLAVPVTSFWVMPCGLLAYLLMPFGLEGWAVEGMGLGIRVILWTAYAVAGLPGAVLAVPAVPVWALAAVSLGGLWLMVWLRPWRLAGLAGVALFVLAIPLSPKPDLRVTDSGSLVGLRMPDGTLLHSSSRAGRFEAAEWQQRDGLAGEPQAWPKAGTADGVVRCDSLGCLYRREGKVVALVWRPEALAEDCHRADIVLAPKLVAASCPASLVIDATTLARSGAHALTIGRDGSVTLESTRPHPGARPWN